MRLPSRRAAWDRESGKPPPGEDKSLSVDATGFGPPVAEQYTRLERAFGQVRAALTLRYHKD